MLTVSRVLCSLALLLGLPVGQLFGHAIDLQLPCGIGRGGGEDPMGGMGGMGGMGMPGMGGMGMPGMM